MEDGRRGRGEEGEDLAAVGVSAVDVIDDEVRRAFQSGTDQEKCEFWDVCERKEVIDSGV